MLPLTGNDLLKLLSELPKEVLDTPISVSSGCDANGDAEFFSLTNYCVVGGGIVDSAADGVLDEKTLVLLFNETVEDF